MIKKMLIILFGLFLMLETFSVEAREIMTEEWDTGGTKFYVDAEIQGNGSGNAVIVRSSIKKFNSFSMPDAYGGTLSLNVGLESIIYRSAGTIGEAAASVLGVTFDMMDLTSWKIEETEVDGLTRKAALEKAKTVLVELGLPPSIPFCIDTWNQARIDHEIADIIEYRDLENSYEMTYYQIMKDLSESKQGFYMIYYPTQYQGINLMPDQVHMGDTYDLGGAFTAIGIAPDGLIYLYMCSYPEQEGKIIEEGPSISMGQAIELYKEHHWERLY